jgi:predicted RNA-binding Zn ribbon-like protein
MVPMPSSPATARIVKADRPSRSTTARAATAIVEAGLGFVPRRLVTVSGDPVDIPDAQHLVHLQLRRFAGCPVCNLHLRSIVRRHREIADVGIREVVVFHSPADELRVHTADLPFAVIADPSKALYAELGAESSPKAMLDPRSWRPILRGLARSAWAIARRRGRAPALFPHGGRFGPQCRLLFLPAHPRRRWCSRVLCGNRVRVTRYYQRHKDETR